ncbi:MAG: polysaccharide biosynthesis C-terminal domain-containing protein, partial [Burkholderiaceae bacterium]|nr:polysaccharide biosynthesis C-terminal domain-containing protein [Burkholderiaceae bacterium]
KILAPAFYARKDIRTPVKFAAVSLVCVQLCNIVTVPAFSHAGLAISVGIGSCLNATLLLATLIRRKQYQPLKGWGKWMLGVVIASAAMAATLIYLQTGVDWAAMQSEWVTRAGLVLAYIVAAIVVYFGILVAFGLRPRHLRPKHDI